MVKFLFERRCVAPLTLNDHHHHHADDIDDDDDATFLRTFSYLRLPQSRLCLSVLKLDGSLFDVYVGRNATVEELKRAIEEVFSLSPREGQGKISWTHVWGHFCLCYKGQKLVNDKARIRDYKITDGDQLQFIRNMSINYLHSKRQSKVQSVAWKQLSSGSDAHEEKNLSNLANKDSLENQGDSHNYNHPQVAKGTPASEFKLAHFLKGWLSYSKLWGVSRKSSEGKNRPSRFSLHCFGSSSRTTQ